MSEDFEYITVKTGDIVVSAYPELIDTDADKNQLWGYCLRIENNSDELITLKNKNLYLTDEKGRSLCECSEGFNGELPDLQPGEYFEYEEIEQYVNATITAAITAQSNICKSFLVVLLILTLLVF